MSSSDFITNFLELFSGKLRDKKEFSGRIRSTPSLHTEKLVPRNKELWSFRIDKKYRIIFRFKNGSTAIFLLVGPHDWIYKLKF